MRCRAEKAQQLRHLLTVVLSFTVRYQFTLTADF